MSRFRNLALTALTLLAAVPAHANKGVVENGDFEKCDGYSAPNVKAMVDGLMTKNYQLFGSVKINSVRGSIVTGPESIEICDRALADPALIDAFWLRRANLLQAKAIHLLRATRVEEALSVLDQSDAAGRGRAPDVRFEASVGLANKLLRAVALYRLGHRDEARKMLATARATRPYAPSIAELVRVIALALEPDQANMVRYSMEGVPQAPLLLVPLLQAAVLEGRYAEAERYGDQITFAIPRGHGAWTVQSASMKWQHELIRIRAEVAGALAYAKYALGKRDEAVKIMTDARGDVVDAMEAPVTMPSNKQVAALVQADFDARVSVGAQASRRLDDWQRAIELRQDLAGKSAASVIALQKTGGITDDLPLPDLLSQLRPANDAERQWRETMIRDFLARMATARRDAFPDDPASLIALLPPPEVATMLPPIERREADTGYGVAPDPHNGLITVWYGGTMATRAMAEEAAMVSAARYVRRLGNDAFIIEGAQSLERKVQVMTDKRKYDFVRALGFETRLAIRPVDAGALPADVDAKSWRVIKVADVLAVLDAQYPEAATGK